MPDVGKDCFIAAMEQKRRHDLCALSQTFCGGTGSVRIFLGTARHRPALRTPRYLRLLEISICRRRPLIRPRLCERFLAELEKRAQLNRALHIISDLQIEHHAYALNRI